MFRFYSYFVAGAGTVPGRFRPFPHPTGGILFPRKEAGSSVKKAILVLWALLLVLGAALPVAGYRMAGRLLGAAASGPAASAPASSAPAQEPGGLAGLTGLGSAEDTQVVLCDEDSGQTFTLSMKDYIIGAVASEMPVSWPDEALKAQAVACHSYILYCRDHRANQDDPWLTVDPARRQGCLTDTVLRSYWGTAYEANYDRLSAVLEPVLNQAVYYDGAPAGTSYFAISNGQTESSQYVWGTALPYLTAVDSSTDRNAQDYEVTVTLSDQQVSAALASSLGISTGEVDPSAWFGTPSYTPSGYVDSLPVCGQTVQGTALRSALGLRSSCFSIQHQGDGFAITTRGYGHGVGLSQWGAKAMAEQGKSWIEILAHYFPGTTLEP